jgi:uncharacterized heparinase superfamily protein
MHGVAIDGIAWHAETIASDLRRLAKVIRHSPHLLTDPADRGLAADRIENFASQMHTLLPTIESVRR